jgi:hypothetical protein
MISIRRENTTIDSAIMDALDDALRAVSHTPLGQRLLTDTVFSDFSANDCLPLLTALACESQIAKQICDFLLSIMKQPAAKTENFISTADTLLSIVKRFSADQRFAPLTHDFLALLSNDGGDRGFTSLIFDRLGACLGAVLCSADVNSQTITLREILNRCASSYESTAAASITALPYCMGGVSCEVHFFTVASISFCLINCSSRRLRDVLIRMARCLAS